MYKRQGEEIARLAVASIDEDRLNRLAEQAIRDLYEDQWFDGRRCTKSTKWPRNFSEKKSNSILLIF